MLWRDTCLGVCPEYVEEVTAETRNPKHEIRNSKQIPMLQIQMTETG
jgi:hypothetical protein